MQLLAYMIYFGAVLLGLHSTGSRFAKSTTRT
jgi:hypothetical protein